jgi:tetratricopeptide (TPR) repeat protein
MVGGPGCDPSPGAPPSGTMNMGASSSSSSSSTYHQGQGSLSGALSSSSVQHGLGTAAGTVEAFHAAMERAGNATSMAMLGAGATLTAPPLSFQQQQPNRMMDPVERTIEGFLSAAASGRLADLPPTGAVFGAQEELRIRNRAKVLAGHLAPGIAPEEATAPLFRALGISPVESFLDGRYEQTIVGEGGEWARAFAGPTAVAQGGRILPQQEETWQGKGGAEWSREFGGDWEAQWRGAGQDQEEGMMMRSRLGEVLRNPAIEANPTLRESDFIKFLGRISNGAPVEAAAAEAQARAIVGSSSASVGLSASVGGSVGVSGSTLQQQHELQQRQQQQRRASQEAAGGAWAAEFAALEGGAYHGQQAVGNAASSAATATSGGWETEFREGGMSEWEREFGSLERAGGGRAAEDVNLQGPLTWVDEYGEAMAALSVPVYEEPHQRDYVLAPLDQNPFALHPDPVSFARAKLYSAEDGALAEAALALEAALHRNAEDPEVWVTLGQVHADSDDEVRAIQALRRAIALDPTNLAALTALATSYANENEHVRAIECFEQWILATPAYRHLYVASPPGEQLSRNMGFAQYRMHHDRIVGMFLSAARANPMALDADIQSALGVLYNLTGEYDKAIDCFRAALHARPTDHLLWNKLGASLANSTPSRSEEAAESYLKALETKPMYLRAIANLGISYTNRQMWREAAEHYLGVIARYKQKI